MKKIFFVFALLSSILVFSSFSAAFADETVSDGGQAFQVLERVEIIVYGAPQSGGLLPRLNAAEKNVFGRELPGSLTERQTAMLDFLEKGTATQSSLLFRLGVLEWAVSQQTHPSWALAKRIDVLESLTEGVVQQGALSARIDRLITKVLPEGVFVTPVSLPATTIVKASLSKTLSVRNVKVDDKVVLNLIEEIVSGGSLVAPKGSRVFAHITKVKPPRSFGRASEIEMAFDSLEALGPCTVPVTMGESAKKAMEADASIYGAAGASFAGAVLLGPVGLASGFLVRGSDKHLKEGTVFYVETTQAQMVSSYTVPSQISSFVRSGDVTLPQGNAPLNP